MPQRTLERALAVWREADRLLASSDRSAPEAARLQNALLKAQSAYASLATHEPVSDEVLDRAKQAVDEAEAELRPVDEPPITGPGVLPDMEPSSGSTA